LHQPNRFRNWLLGILLGVLLLVAAAGAGLFFLAKNLTPVARWTLQKSLPQADVDVQDVQLVGPGELTFTHLVINDPQTGKELVRLERGRAVFSFDDLASRRIGEIHLDSPVLVVSPGWSGILPDVPKDAGTGAPLGIRRIVCEDGEIVYEGEKTGSPNVRAKFCLDWQDFSTESTTPLGITFWDVRATAPGFTDPFLVLDLVRLTGAPADMIKKGELQSVEVAGGALAVGAALDQMASHDQPAPAPTTLWRIGRVEIKNVHTSLGDNAWHSEADAAFSLNTTLANLTPAEITNTLAGTQQLVEINDLVIPSPRDPFTRVLALRSVFVRFTLAGILAKEIQDVTVLNPVVYVGEDLFLYMDAARNRMASGSASTGTGWRIQRFDVKFGSLMLGSGGKRQYGLPLNFRTTAENVALDDLASLTLQGSLELPAQEYQFPAYQIAFATEPGELQFSYPPEKEVSNVVGTVKITSLQWRQYRASDAWITATFDREGINSSFGGVIYSGDITGGFSFFFHKSSPWIGWLGGIGVDLRQLTDIIAPQNFRMTGPLDFTLQVNAEAKAIRRLQAKLTTNTPGRLEIGKIDDLLARIPPEWPQLKKSSLRIALESLRDFEYSDGSGGFWFADSQGILDLKLQGPLGSRTFQTVLHADESPGGLWKKAATR
jgi:hypothetical protein